MSFLRPLLRVLDPRPYPRLIAELLTVCWERRELVRELIRREIAERYAGEVFGAAWAFGHPLISVGIYLIVFNLIFRGSGVGDAPSAYGYAVFLLAGLVPWLVSAEVMNKSPSILLSHASLAKQIVFPIEVLPLKATAVTLVTLLVGLAATVAYVALRYGTFAWTYALLPLVILLQACLNLGMAYALAAIAPFFRDIKDFITVFCNLGLFLTPAFYLGNTLPAFFKILIALNPFSAMVWVYQDTLYYGAIVHPVAWGVFIVLSLFSFALGYRAFRALRPAFGDVL